MSEEKKEGFRLPGLPDIQNTPCAREALLHGSAAYMVTGLLHFLATSRVRRSFDVGMAGFLLTTLASWSYCRYSAAQMRFQQRVIQEGMRRRAIYEGSGLDPNMNLQPKALDPQSPGPQP